MHDKVQKMIAFEEALQLMLNCASSLELEEIDYTNSLNRVLAEDIYSDVNMPPFDKSAMDGYACRKEDLAEELELIEVIAAGSVPQMAVGKNQCSKIMTGAILPQGADTVLIIEECEVLSNGRIRFVKETSKSNICYIAEDVKKGDLLIEKNTRLKTTHAAILASVGKTKIKVYRLPQIAVISTGSELVDPNEIPADAQIRNSNAASTMAQLAYFGFSSHYFGIVKDNEPDLHAFLDKTKDFDVVILSGAVSVGDYDFVPKVLKDRGVYILFHGVYAKPGKRTIFGKSGRQYFFGVPGNPVSSFIQVQYLLIPFLFSLNNIIYLDKKLKLPICENFKRKRADVLEFVPVRINENSEAERLLYHGSAHFAALGNADGFMLIEKGMFELKAGELADVRLL